MRKILKLSMLLAVLVCCPLQAAFIGMRNVTEAAELPTLQYGEPVPWETVEKLFPRKSNAQVIDLETGLSFNVQRRAGSRHADVQPLTKLDSRTMKEIYNGKWSWKRRAILVKIDGRYLAASMNGMPHGVGAIGGNNFRGHFCIHFQGSSTHKRPNPDPGHQLMIWKSSGQLGTVLADASPYQLLDYFLTALKEQDTASMQLMLDASQPQAVEEFLAKTATIENLKRSEPKDKKKQKITRLEAEDADDGEDSDQADDSQQEEKSIPAEPDTTGLQAVEIPVKLTVRYTSQRKDTKKPMVVLVKRDAKLKRWMIDVKSLHDGFFSDNIPR